MDTVVSTFSSGARVLGGRSLAPVARGVLRLAACFRFLPGFFAFRDFAVDLAFMSLSEKLRK